MNNAIHQMHPQIQWPEQNNNPIEFGFHLNLHSAKTPISRVNSFQAMQELSEDNQQLLHMVNQLLSEKLKSKQSIIEDSVLATGGMIQVVFAICALKDQNLSMFFKMAAVHSTVARLYFVRKNQKSTFYKMNSILNNLVNQYGQTTADQLAMLEYDDPKVNHKVAEIMQFSGQTQNADDVHKVIESMQEIKTNTPVLKKYYHEALNILNQFSLNSFKQSAVFYRARLVNVADMIEGKAPAIRDGIQPKQAMFK